MQEVEQRRSSCRRLDPVTCPAFAFIELAQQFQPTGHGRIVVRSQRAKVVFELPDMSFALRAFCQVPGDELGIELDSTPWLTPALRTRRTRVTRWTRGAR